MILFEKKNKYGSFNDLMDVSIETGDKWLDKKLNTNICYGKGGGGSAPQDVPKTLRPYVKQVLDRAKGLYGSYTPQELYQGERIVGFTPQEQAAQEGVASLVERGISADRALTSGSTYYQPALDLLGESGDLGRRAVQDITAEEIMGRMSPYQQAVTDIAKRKAAQEGQMYMTELGGQAARTGGFGGSRQAILEGQAMGDLGQRLTDIQTTGSQAAYQDAVRAAEAQRARLSGGAQQAGALSQAFGALGQQALGQGYREQGYLAGLGEQERGLQQQRADLAYQQFVEQRDYPDVQLQKFSSLIQGFPFNFQQTPQQPSAFQQAVGGVATIGGLGRGLDFFNKGGKIDGNREGGLSNVVYRQEGGQPTKENSYSLKDSIFKHLFLRPSPYALDEEETFESFENEKQRLIEQAKKENNLNTLKQIEERVNLIDKKILPGLKPRVSKLQQEAAQKEKTAKEIRQRMLPPESSTPAPEGFTGETPLPAQPEAAPIGADVVKTAEDVTGLQAILDKAFAFDKAAEEKAIKQQQGFDVAALGVQLMSTPLNQIDPALIRNLGVTNKELAGLDEKEAKQLLQKKLTELEIKKLEKELGSIDLIPLFPGIDAVVDSLAQSNRISELAGEEKNQLIFDAQAIASARAIAEGVAPDSAMAERYFREELNKQAAAFKALPRGGSNPNAGIKAGDISGLLQTQLPNSPPPKI